MVIIISLINTFFWRDHADIHRYGVVRQFVGHGVGRVFHADPVIMHYSISLERSPLHVTYKHVFLKIWRIEFPFYIGNKDPGRMILNQTFTIGNVFFVSCKLLLFLTICLGDIYYLIGNISTMWHRCEHMAQHRHFDRCFFFFFGKMEIATLWKKNFHAFPWHYGIMDHFLTYLNYISKALITTKVW